VNPASGGGRAARAEPRVASYFVAQGAQADFVRSVSGDDIREKASRAVAEGYRCVAALGGDGAFHHVVEGVRGTSATAAFLPAGNGNDIAAALGIPTDPIAAAEVLLGGHARAVDLIGVRLASGTTAHYIGAGGLGLDAAAAYLANTRFKAWPGLTRYVAGAVEAVRLEPTLALEAELDDERWNGEALFAAVANGPRYGAGIRIAPEAKIDDGWMDVLIVGKLPIARLVEGLATLIATGDVRFPEVRRYRCKRAAMRTVVPAKVHGDGELLGESPAKFEIVPGAIRVMAPRLGQQD